jgi:hypothetical protein
MYLHVGPGWREFIQRFIVSDAVAMRTSWEFADAPEPSGADPEKKRLA